MNLANLTLSPETQMILPLSLICTLLTLLIITTWRLANFVRDLREAVGKSWTFRDQERWALTMERENRARGFKVWVPDVVRANEDDTKDPVKA